MIARSPLEAVELLDEAFNRGDIEEVLSFYEEEATMVVEPGRLARGKTELRRAYEWIFVNLKGTATQEKTDVIEVGELALFTSRWNYSGTTPNGTVVARESYATVILRQSADGGWRIVVDNSWGPSILG
jgi:uncharacterized protein (TIGR02246 family)